MFQSSSITLKNLIDNFCFKWKTNETIWPLADSRIFQEFSNRIPRSLWSLSSTIFDSNILNEERFIDRNTTCNLRAGLFPEEV